MAWLHKPWSTLRHVGHEGVLTVCPEISEWNRLLPREDHHRQKDETVHLHMSHGQRVHGWPKFTRKTHGDLKPEFFQMRQGPPPHSALLHPLWGLKQELNFTKELQRPAPDFLTRCTWPFVYIFLHAGTEKPAVHGEYCYVFTALRVCARIRSAASLPPAGWSAVSVDSPRSPARSFTCNSDSVIQSFTTRMNPVLTGDTSSEVIY